MNQEQRKSQMFQSMAFVNLLAGKLFAKETPQSPFNKLLNRSTVSFPSWKMKKVCPQSISS